MSINIKCPTCDKLCVWEDNKWRPFCSERCRLIDLGAWIDGDYCIAGSSPMEIDEQELEM